MICCTIAVLILGAPVWLVRRVFAAPFQRQPKPLAWRLYPAGAATPSRRQFRVAARLKSFVFAFNGLGFLIRNEHNAWIHAALSLAVIGAGLVLQLRAEDWRWIALSIALVWAAEAFNTSIEAVCNLVSPGRNEAIRIAKDVAAGAVLVTAIGAAVLGALTFWPYLQEMGMADAVGSMCGAG